MSRRKLLINFKKNVNGSLPHFSTLQEEELAFQNIPPALDDTMRRRYTLAFVNAIIGLGAMILQLQVAWDGTQLVNTNSAEALRIFIFITTIFLILQLLDYYNIMLQHITHDWTSRKALGFNITAWTVLRASSVAPFFWLEVAVVLIQPLPFGSVLPRMPGGGPSFWADEKWGLLMYLRLYMLARVLRDHSTIFKKRQNIARTYRNSAPPKFNYVLAVKAVFGEHPIWFIVTSISFTLLLCGHLIYVFEREADPAVFTFIGSLYLSFISMITGWPTDTYEEFNPATLLGRSACILSTFFGLFLLSALIELFGSKLTASAHQRPALAWVTHHKLKRSTRDCAARVIQIFWRHYRYRCNPSSIRTRHERDYSLRYMEAIERFRTAMRRKNAVQARLQELHEENQYKSKYLDPGSAKSEQETRLEDRVQALEELVARLAGQQDILVPELSRPPDNKFED